MSFSIKGQTYPVTYNSIENSYAFQYDSTPVKIYLDAGGNCTKFLAGNNNAFSSNYFYQNNRKGPLTNGGNMSLTNLIFPEPMFLTPQAYLNTLAIPLDGSATSSIGTTSISTSYANEFDSDNFLINSIITTTKNTASESGTSIKKYTYHYIEL